MNITEKELLMVLTTALNPSKECPIVSNVKDLCDEAKKHTVFPLVADVVMRSSAADQYKQEMLKDTAPIITGFHQLMSVQTKTLALLDAHNIPAAVMKGAAAAQYYSKPELRHMGDIDLLVLPEDFERAFTVLCKAGYQNNQELNSDYQRHIGFREKSGIEIELHRYFSSSRDVKQNTYLDNCLYNALRHLQYPEVCGYRVSVFPAVENGMVLLGHINQHLSSGLGLRQIIDWFFFAEAVLNDDFWENSFREKSEAIGMRKLAVIVTRMCQEYLGLTEKITWCKNAGGEELADELMNYIMEKGNFGRKVEKDKQRTVSVMHSLSNPKDAFSYLTKAGSIHMKEAGLKPTKVFAWLYQIGHLIRMTWKRCGHLRLGKEIKTGREEIEFLKKLEVTRW